MRPLAKKLQRKQFEDKVEHTAAKWVVDDTNEQLIHLIEDENAKKLNMTNTLKRVFNGSKFYLFALCTAILINILRDGLVKITMIQHYADKWESVTICNVTDVIDDTEV